MGHICSAACRLHLPVAYHGRASSVVVSGTPVRRPLGQARLSPCAASPATDLLQFACSFVGAPRRLQSSAAMSETLPLHVVLRQSAADRLPRAAPAVLQVAPAGPDASPSQQASTNIDFELEMVGLPHLGKRVFRLV